LGYFPKGDGSGNIVLYAIDEPPGLTIVDGDGADLATVAIDPARASIERRDPSGSVRWSRPLPGGPLKHLEMLGMDVASNHLALGRIQGRIVVLDLETGDKKRDAAFTIPFAPGLPPDHPTSPARISPTVAPDGRVAAVVTASRNNLKGNPVMQAFLFGLPPLDCPL
jgi:hypothetical protein